MSMSSAAFRLGNRARSFTVALHAGRLIEIRVEGQIRTRHDVEEFSDSLWRKISESKRSVVIIADYRKAVLFAPDRADEWSSLMVSVSHRVERSAIVIDKEKATFNLQLQRGVIRAANRNRKLFFDVPEARAWISPVLDDLETARLVRFLAPE